MSTQPPIAETRHLEAAHWFVRVREGSLTPSERANFANWFNFSRWNRLAYEQVARVWNGAPSTADHECATDKAAPARFSWHHADAWRDAVLPLAMRWHLPRVGASGEGERQRLPVQAAAAPAGLL